MWDILMVIVCVALIILSLLQSGKSEGLVSALTGQNSSLFKQTKERGPELVLSTDYAWVCNRLFHYCSDHSYGIS